MYKVFPRNLYTMECHTYIPTYIHTYIHTCMHAYIHTYIHTYIHPNLSNIYFVHQTVLKITRFYSATIQIQDQIKYKNIQFTVIIRGVADVKHYSRFGTDLPGRPRCHYDPTTDRPGSPRFTYGSTRFNTVQPGFGDRPGTPR